MAKTKYLDPSTGEYVEFGSDMYGENRDLQGVKATPYHYDDWFMNHTAGQVERAIEYMLQNGWTGTSEDKFNLLEYIKESSDSSIKDVYENEIPYIIEDAILYLEKNGVNLDNVTKYHADRIEQSAKQSAFDEYYNDLYSLEQGTLGRELLDNYVLAEQNAALSNMELAEAQYQQAAMQQAETVKAITDSVKAERMARLRAGMSESQIANQDMQTMLSNMNTLNQSMNTMNQNRYAAQQQYDLAQDTAYQQYINSATQLGSIGAAYSAASAGNADYIARQYAKNVNKLYTPTQYKKVTDPD